FRNNSFQDDDPLDSGFTSNFRIRWFYFFDEYRLFNSGGNSHWHFIAAGSSTQLSTRNASKNAAGDPTFNSTFYTAFNPAFYTAIFWLRCILGFWQLLWNFCRLNFFGRIDRFHFLFLYLWFLFGSCRRWRRWRWRS